MGSCTAWGQTLLLSFSLFLCYAERVDRVGHTDPAKAASRMIGVILKQFDDILIW
jgi:hypothetical protein